MNKSKRYEHHKRDHWFYFALGLKTPYVEERHNPHNLVHIALFGHSWWIKIPQLIKPKEKWVDCSQYEWAKERDGKKGYTEQIQKDYGFSCNSEALHIHYGIQPGCWIRDDKENSDHTKVFWWPWHSTIVRHDLLYPNGDVFHRNLYPKNEYEEHLNWHHVLENMKPKSDGKFKDLAVYVELEHYNKSDGKLQKAYIRLTGEEREWRPKCTRWLPIFRKIERVVWCDSDTELGTRAGSWKGGMMGWGCEWRKGESMKESFRRWYKNWSGE